MKPKLLFSIIFILLLGSVTNAASSHAGVMDRIKGIYQAPEKVEELQAHVTEATQQIEEARRQAEQLLQQNAELQKQNEALAAQNRLLQGRMEEMDADRRTLYRQLTATGITAFLLILGYAAAVRIWRYTVWRKQRKEEHEVTML